MRSTVLVLAILLLPFVSSFPLLLRHDSRFLHSSAPLTQPAPTQYISQPLDHTSPSSPQFLQRFWLNSSLYPPDSVPSVGFLSLGGEGPDSPSSVSHLSALASYYATPFHPLLVSLEHRFYGESVPFSDVSPSNLRFLTSTQALADATHLILNISSTLSLPSTTPWIVFGGSYAGTLSAQLKLLYPQLVKGSIASSAPVRAVVDFPQYLDVVEEGLGAECRSVVKESTELIEAMMETPAQRKFLLRVFNQCEEVMEGEKDRSMFFSNALGPITALVQYNSNYRPINIQSACRMMIEERARSNALVALAKFNAYYNTVDNGTMPFASGAQCQNTSYTSYIQFMQENSADRQWYWQTCNEVGFFQTAEGNSAFSTRYLPLSFYTDQCYDIFGITFNASRIADYNERYQSYDLHTNNTAFTNGLVDPWHTRGILKEEDVVGDGNRVDVIGPTSHCQDIGFPRDSDPPYLKAARWRNVLSINGWIGGQPMPSSTGGDGPAPSSTGGESSGWTGESSGSSGSSGESSTADSSTADSSSSGSSGGDGGGGGSSRSASMQGLVGIIVFILLVVSVAGGAGYWYWKKGRFRTATSAELGVMGRSDGALNTGYSSLLGNEGGRGTV